MIAVKNRKFAVNVPAGVKLRTINIVSLPRELQSTKDIQRFMKDMLDLICVRVQIVRMQSESGRGFRSAFMDIDSKMWKPTVTGIFNGHGILSERIPGGIHFDNGEPMGLVKVVDVSTITYLRSYPTEKKKEEIRGDDSASLLAKIEDLTAEIARIKSYSVVPVPGMPFTIDVGQILAENHRLKEEIQRLKR